MSWNLIASTLPEGAKDYLSQLGSCGDEHEAAKRAAVSEADIRKWSRDDEFLDHRRQALAYYESWKDWKAGSEDVDPARWPSRGRLDQRYDPYRVQL